MDPKLAMFTQPDWFEVTDPGVGTNRYAYAGDDPVNASDPGGNREISVWQALFGSMGPGDWTSNARIHNTGTWKSANSYNLQQDHGADEYRSIEERADFYRWFQTAEKSRGDAIRWPGAAAKIADGVNQSTYLMVGEADKFMNNGNKIIFDNAFPKLRARSSGEPLDEPSAAVWDARILSEEQHLTQHLYNGAKTGGYYDAIKRAATGDGLWAVISPSWVRTLTGNAPPFPGSLDSVSDRWNFGMSQMGYPSRVGGMPQVSDGRR